MIFVTLTDGTACRVDTNEGRAWELVYGERNGHGEERWFALDLRSAVAGEAFELAYALDLDADAFDDAPDHTDADAPLGFEPVRALRLARAA